MFVVLSGRSKDSPRSPLTVPVRRVACNPSSRVYRLGGGLGFRFCGFGQFLVRYVFWFSLLKIAVFRFCCFVRFAGFFQFSLVFGFFNNDGWFQQWRLIGFFCPLHLTIFPVLPRKLHLAVSLKLLFQGTTYS